MWRFFIAAVVCCLDVTSHAEESLSLLTQELKGLLGATGDAFEQHWQHIQRESPLVPIDLEDVEQWLRADASSVREHDIELFARPPDNQAGQGGDFRSAPEPVPVKNRLKNVRKAFGEGQSLVINSLHSWCPKAAKLAEALKAEVGLPVDVYMYLTPPYSHSYGLHTDVMDAFMVQLVGKKHWRACALGGSTNCSDVDVVNGDVLYLPMQAHHAAWTSNELSAHLTVNVERQFYVWGAYLQALAVRVLLPKTAPHLAGLPDLREFGMEGESEFSVVLMDLAKDFPKLMVMPAAVLHHTREGLPLDSQKLEGEWVSFLEELKGFKSKRSIRLSFAGQQRKFGSLSKLAQTLRQVDSGSQLEGLSWVAELTEKSVMAMQRQHRGARPQQKSSKEQKQKLSAIAAAYAKRMSERVTRDQEL